MIRWLHISDLHFNDEDMSTNSLRDELPRFLSRNNIKCDYVFCTGDIRVGGKPFPDEAADYLKNLCAAVGTDTSRLFIVPGNHDVNRNLADRNNAIGRVLLDRESYYDPAAGKIEETDIVEIQKGKEEFHKFLSLLYPADRLKCYKEPHFAVETPDFNILHVDSTLTYCDGHEANDLILGTFPLYRALEGCNPAKPTVLLSHYPITSLLQDEKKHVSELLYRYGVCLWLAGHEHDHNLMPYKYLNSIQAGELRHEDRAHATVLVGNYDPDTMSGYITAYTWFDEGWAAYPLIWHNLYCVGDEDKYPFALRRPGDNGKSREGVLAEKANQQYISRLPEKVWDNLFPDFEVDDVRYTTGILSYLRDAWNTDTPHLIMLADGGMGKSTMLLSACKREESALYISLDSLLTMTRGIEEYSAETLFGGDEDKFHNYAREKHSTPSLILFVDGLNEVDGETERNFINEIKRLNLYKGIQIVITSRSDFTPRYSMSGYQHATLLPLTDAQMKPVLTDWEMVERLPTLRCLLTNPMMLTMYVEVSPIMKKYGNCEFLRWKAPIQNATDLLYDFYLAQVALLINREGVMGEKVISAAQCVFDVLPYLAYQYESSYRFNISNREFRDLVKAAVELPTFNADLLDLIAEYFRCSVKKANYQEVIDILTNDLHLIYKGNEYTSFPHQIYRDYLSALWICQETVRAEDINGLWNSRGIPRSVMTHVSHLGMGIAENVYAAGRNREDAFNLVGNFLDCFPSFKDYSFLDLRGLQLPNNPGVKRGEISLKGTRLDTVSIGKIASKPRIFQKLSFSDDNGYLVACEGDRIFIFPLRTNEEVFRYDLGSIPAQLVFVGDYLFAPVGCERISVFKYLNGWAYTGEITSQDGTFKNNLKKIVLKDEFLYFYFSNRERQYRLPEGKLIKNVQRRWASEDAVEGYDLTFMAKNLTSKHKKRKKVKKTEDIIVCTVSNNGLTATSYEDGALIVSGENEIYNILNRGVTLLKDGAISGDGKWVATLSYEVFSDCRRVQLWNLDEKKKQAELYCPCEISKLNLSQYGNWIIGQTKDKSWVYSIMDGDVQWFDEHFISNQRSKIVTYGDIVLRRNQDNLAYTYNLKTKEEGKINNLTEDVGIAAIMPDGTLASVGRDVRKPLFKNISDGRTMDVNRKRNPVIGIYPLKKKEFIALATQNNEIGIYHTRTGQPLKYIDTHNAGNYMVAVHSDENVIACSSGRTFETFNFYEKVASGQQMGWWYENQYRDEHRIGGTVLDLAFNAANKELVVILTNGEIVFCNDKYCRYHSTLGIITNFNVDAYDFRGCECSDEIRELLRQNDALI